MVNKKKLATVTLFIMAVFYAGFVFHENFNIPTGHVVQEELKQTSYSIDQHGNKYSMDGLSKLQKQNLIEVLGDGMFKIKYPDFDLTVYRDNTGCYTFEKSTKCYMSAQAAMRDKIRVLVEEANA